MITILCIQNNLLILILLDYIQLYETVMNEAQALFGSSLEEEKLLAEFVAYMKDNIQARHSIAGCTKRFSDRRYYERNE